MTSTNDENNSYTASILNFIRSSAPDRQVLVLVDDEMAFVKGKGRSRDKHKKRKPCQGHGDDNGDDPIENNNKRTRNLFAIVADGIDELIFNHWQQSIESYLQSGAANETNSLCMKHPTMSLSSETATSETVEVQLCEVKYFITNLVKGNVRAVELLEGVDYQLSHDTKKEKDDGSISSASSTLVKFEILYQSPNWVELRNHIGGMGLLYGLEHARSCCGMVSTILRCKAHDEREVENHVKLLLHRSSMRNEAIWQRRSEKAEEEIAKLSFVDNGRIGFEASVKEKVNEIWGDVKKLIQEDPNPERRNLRKLTEEQYDFIFQWHDSIKSESNGKWFEKQHQPSILNQSQMKQTDDVKKLIQRLEMPVEACDVLFMVRSGSYLFNLSTSTSDEDYTVVYITSMPLLLSHSPPPEFHTASVVSPLGFAADKRGEVEYDAREIGKFAAECCKGNPKNIELLFFNSDHAVYMSPEFQLLRDNRSLFLTGRCCSQYYGFISERLSMVEKYLNDGENEHGSCDNQLPDSSEAAIAKLFYHAFHKLYQIQRIVQYQDPVVRLENGSSERNFIMKIRTTRPLTGDLSPSILLAKAYDMLSGSRKLQKAIDQKRKDEGLFVRPRDVNVDKIRAVMEQIRFMNMIEIQPPLPLSRSKSLQRDRSENSSQGDDDLPNNVLVNQCFAEIEDKHNIRIIFASESSSRVIGTSHENSDHDIAAIFVYQTNRYLSMRPLAKSFRANFPSQCSSQPDVEIVLWESRHAFELLANNNLTLLEAFQSPLIYRVFSLNEAKNSESSTQNWDRQVLHMTGAVFDRKRLARSALSQGESNYHRFIKARSGGDVRQKKYIHVIRKVLLVEWLLDVSTANLWPPPICLLELLQSLQECNDSQHSSFEYTVGCISHNVREEIMEMIEQKNLPKLNNLGGHRPLLDTWIISRISFLKAKLSRIPGCKEKESAIISQWDELLIPLMKAASAF